MPVTAVAFWIVYVSGCVGALLYPAVGVMLYVFVYHINPETQWWGGSFASTGLRSSLTVALATVIGIALRCPKLGESGRQFPSILVLAFCFTALVVLSQILGYGPSPRGAQQAEKLIKIMIFLVLLVRCIRTPFEFHCLILAWVLGVAYIGYQAYGGIGVRYHGRLARGLGGPDFSDSSDLAIHLVASLPLIAVLFVQYRHTLARIFIAAIGALAVNTIVMTRTRNAVFGFLAMGVVAVFSLPREYRARGFLAMTLAVALAYQLVDPGWIERMRTISDYQSDASATSRIAYWTVAVEMTFEYPFGIGVGNFQRAVLDYVDELDVRRGAHSTYFECLAEVGPLGLLLLLSVLLLAYRRARHTRVQAVRRKLIRPVPHPLGITVDFNAGLHALGLQCALAAYVASAVFATRYCAEDLWLLIGMICCFSNVVRGWDELAAVEPVAALTPVHATAPQTG